MYVLLFFEREVPEPYLAPPVRLIVRTALVQADILAGDKLKRNPDRVTGPRFPYRLCAGHLSGPERAMENVTLHQLKSIIDSRLVLRRLLPVIGPESVRHIDEAHGPRIQSASLV